MRRTRILAIGALTLLLAGAGFASDLEKQLQNDYVGKYWVIHGFYDGAELRFDSSSKLISGGPPQPWTVAGVEVTSLKLHPDNVEIKGKRVAYTYDTAQHKFTPVYRVLRKNRKQEVEPVKIIVEEGGAADEAGIRHTLAQVLLPEHAELNLDVPGYWRPFLAHGEQPRIKPWPGSVVGRLGDVRVYSPGSEVKQPRPISTPDPVYSEQARQAGFQGTLVLRMIIDKDGHPRDVRIARPLGLGLDDKAVEAVQGWQFKPAEREGEPVAVQMDVEVTFRLFEAPH